MGTLKDLKQELDDLVDHYVAGVTLIVKQRGDNEETIRGLANLLKLAQAKAIDNHLSVGYDSSEERPPKLERNQHGTGIPDDGPAPRTDVGG